MSEPTDLGRREPIPYDLGLTDDPEFTWDDLELWGPDLEPEP